MVGDHKKLVGVVKSESFRAFAYFDTSIESAKNAINMEYLDSVYYSAM